MSETPSGADSGAGAGAGAGVRAEAEAQAPGEPSYEPAAPAPLGIARTLTGHAEVDAELERLGDVDHLAADGHVEVYEDVHQGLRTALTALDTVPRPSSPYEHRS
jgi:hypothetical protein